jgi:hypothetical protein
MFDSDYRSWDAASAYNNGNGPLLQPMLTQFLLARFRSSSYSRYNKTLMANIFALLDFTWVCPYKNIVKYQSPALFYPMERLK